jgi:O-antigen biosynthesis protein
VFDISSSRKYEHSVDTENKNSCHGKIIGLVGKNKKVLEIGTSTGYLSKIFRDNDNSVTGIEIDRDAGEVAGQYCDRMIIGDIEVLDLDQYVNDPRFDVIVLGDVLEHLKFPGQVLVKIKKYLKADGYIVVSLPNVCHGDLILNLMCGDFRYTPIGLLDNTHIRFFGLKNMLDLFYKGGYSVVSFDRVISPIGSTELRVAPENIPEDLLKFIISIPDADVYQFVFKAIPCDAPDDIVLPGVQLTPLFNKSIEGTIIKRLEPFVQVNSRLEQETARLKQKDLEIYKLESLVNESNNKVDKLNDQITQTIRQKQELEQELREMRLSIVWRLTMKYHTLFVDGLLPHSTRRRRAYDLGLKGARVIANEGLGSFWRQYNERKVVKRIERSIMAKSMGQTTTKYDLKDWGGENIMFPVARDNVEVSIVIPVFNKSKYTYNCLSSIQRNTGGSYEVIVVDDASNDDTGELLCRVKNAVVISNMNNLGFIGSCNKGAAEANGKFVLFLNNDTIVTKGWLDNMLEAIKKDGAGAVGAKLVYPDGRLQETGGIIWSDSSGWNYGRGDDLEKPEYNFIREVDYCSGAALMINKELFDMCGGFDALFKPAYYEDTDMCFSIRKMGYKVLYQPRSVVVHFEGATGGTDINSGVKKYQAINKDKFMDKWHDILLADHYPPDSTRLFLARTRKKGKTILVIDHYVPTFDKDSGSYRMFNFLKILSKSGHNVTFIGDNLAKSEPYTSALQQEGIEVIYGPYARSIDEYLSNNGRFFDIVILSRAHIAEKNIITVRKYCSQAKIIFDTVDLQFIREERRARIENDKSILDEAGRLKVMEFRLMEMSDVTLVVSPVEKDIINKENPGIKVEIISNILDVKETITPFFSRKDLMFIGGFAHPPNVDAVKWFVKDIFPRIKEKIPGIKFFVVGSDPTEEIKALASDDIIIAGYVNDATPYFEKCKVFVAPLRYGAGVKGKINQSMSYGLPVVTTSIGAEGIGLKDGDNALIADDPIRISEKIIQLYQNEQMWNELSANSIINVRLYFSYELAKERIKNVIDSQK